MGWAMDSPSEVLLPRESGPVEGKETGIVEEGSKSPAGQIKINPRV